MLFSNHKRLCLDFEFLSFLIILKGKEMCLLVKIFMCVLCAFYEFSPGVFGLKISSDRDTSGLSEITFNLESCIASSDKLWIVLNNNNV